VLTALEARIITMNDEVFPEVLRHVALPPAVLFLRGRLELLHEGTRLGVVGSRNFTEYGAECARMLTRPVARAGVTIVSGLARGIDSIAHEAALDVGGDTIAVLGNGIDVYHPARNRRLQERIAHDGLLLTEFPPGTPALPYHFPHRNRIIAYLSKNVLVVEAQRDSGSLSTAAHARESFDVLAVPGPIGRPTSVGTNELIRDGAHAVLTPEDVLYELKVRPSRDVERAPAKPLDIDEDSLPTWQALGDEPMHLDEIAGRSGLPADEVSLALLSLELVGRVRALPGGRYVRA
jgi:DNA processing protein